jgi:hypothetical protein
VGLNRLIGTSRSWSMVSTPEPFTKPLLPMEFVSGFSFFLDGCVSSADANTTHPRVPDGKENRRVEQVVVRVVPTPRPDGGVGVSRLAPNANAAIGERINCDMCSRRISVEIRVFSRKEQNEIFGTRRQPHQSGPRHPTPWGTRLHLRRLRGYACK